MVLVVLVVREKGELRGCCCRIQFSKGKGLFLIAPITG